MSQSSEAVHEKLFEKACNVVQDIVRHRIENVSQSSGKGKHERLTEKAVYQALRGIQMSAGGHMQDFSPRTFQDFEAKSI